MLTEQPTQNQLDILSKALIRQRGLDSSTEDPIAVLFMGQQFDSFPRDLLLDDSITAIDKYAWQRLYIELQKNRNYFPTYNNLQKLWGNMGGELSRKTVRDILSRLVIAGWLSLKVIRGEYGQVVGNVYMIHNTKLEVIDIVTQNDEILTSLMSKKDISKSLAILTYRQVTAYLNSKKQSDDIFLQIDHNQREMVITHNIDNIAPSLLIHLEHMLSSQKELSKNELSSKKELSKNELSSKKELSKNELSSKKEPPIKSMGYGNSSSTSSSIYSSTTSNNQGDSIESCLVIPSSLQERITDKGLRDIMSAITKTGISLSLVNQIFQSVSGGDISNIKNMTAYLVRNIQKAAKGEFNLVPSAEKVFKKNHIAEVNTSPVTLKAKSVMDKERLATLFAPLKSMLNEEVKK